ncbi:MAG TPA: hypothetical protein VKB18_05085 [Gemmatimonadota bacterium]|nr:hypothetical protein [Gemmatimonadota bacterium]
MGFPPEGDDVLTVGSRAREDGSRAFEIEGGDADGELEGLVAGIRHESELVEALRERGWRLTMVGGGAASEEARRFYFRPGG